MTVPRRRQAAHPPTGDPAPTGTAPRHRTLLRRGAAVVAWAAVVVLMFVLMTRFCFGCCCA